MADIVLTKVYVSSVANHSLTNPKRGHRLGSTSASWRKIRSVTDEVPRDVPDQRTRIVEQGPNGELCMWYPLESVFEVWGWLGLKSTYKGDSMVLLYRSHKFVHEVVAFKCLPKEPLGIVTVQRRPWGLTLCVDEPTSFLERPLPSLKGTISLKIGKKVIAVGTSLGYIALYRYISPGLEALDLANALGHSCDPTMRKDLEKLPQRHVVIQTETEGNLPLFDLVGDWLVYCPAKTEREYTRILASTNSTLHDTPMALPPDDPVLYQVASTISNTTLDGLFKLSELGSKKVKHYWNEKKDEKVEKNEAPAQNLGKYIGTALSSTANKLRKLPSHASVKILDLVTGDTMATFKVPGGVSHLSLNPFDLQLVNANQRGDTFYLWDLCQVPSRVKLLGKFPRGKTSALIEDMTWFANKASDSTYGFGSISTRTGSIHWYKDVSSSGTSGQSGGAENSWILASVRARRFFTLPQCSNLANKSASAQLAFLDRDDCLRLVSPSEGYQDSKYNLLPGLADCGVSDNRLSDRLCASPSCVFGTSSGDFGNYRKIARYTSVWHPEFSGVELLPKSASKEEVPSALTQVEIHTCEPYLSLVTNEFIRFATYDTGGQSVQQLFKDFGEEVPVKVIDFGPTREPILSENPVEETSEGKEVSPSKSLNDLRRTPSETQKEVHSQMPNAIVSE